MESEDTRQKRFREFCQTLKEKEEMLRKWQEEGRGGTKGGFKIFLSWIRLRGYDERE
jgi:hypothetical protein